MPLLVKSKGDLSFRILSVLVLFLALSLHMNCFVNSSVLTSWDRPNVVETKKIKTVCNFEISRNRKSEFKSANLVIFNFPFS